MAQLTSDQIDDIVDENGAQAKRRTIKETFSSRVHGFWAGSGMGMLYGGMMGAMVAVVGAMAGASLGALFLPLVGAYALAGMAFGATVMTAVGAPAGAAAANAKEAERKKLAANPDAALTEAAKFNSATQDTPRKKTLLNHLLPFNEGSKKIFSLRNAVIFGGLALAAGALMLSLGGAPLLAGIAGAIGHQVPVIAAAAVTGTGAAATLTHAGIAMALATAALFGASFGFDGATVAANSTQFVSDIFSGKKLAFGKSKSAEMDAPVPVSPPLRMTITPEEAAQLNDRLDCRGRNFAQTLATQQMQVQPANITTGV